MRVSASGYRRHKLSACGLFHRPCTSWRCCVQAYGDDILLHLNVANFLPSIPLQLLTVRWREQPGADARRGGERWVWARLLLGAALNPKP